MKVKIANPTSRKRLNPLPVDENVSYGVTIPNDTDKISRLSNSTSETIFIDFSDDTLIDNNASTAAIESLILTGETKKRATLPRKVTETLHKTTRNYSPWAIPDGEGGFEDFSDLTCNEHWYVSFDKNRNYETRPNWLNNHFTLLIYAHRIHTICHKNHSLPQMHHGQDLRI